MAKTTAQLLSELNSSIIDNTSGVITPAVMRTMLNDVITSLLTQLDVDQVVVGGADITAYSLGTQSSGTLTIDCGKCPLQFVTNNGAFTLHAPSADGSCLLLVINGSSAGTITLSGFSTGSSVGDTYNTTNGNMFTFSIWRINGTSGYRVAAHQ